MRYLSVAVSLVLLAATGVWAQDQDGDTIPDAVEALLATDPTVADELVLVKEDDTREGDDREQYDPCHDITAVLFGHGGGDRFVWCVEFLEDFCPADSTVILYIDADNDEATGRQTGSVGTEFMLHSSGGSASATVYHPDGTRGLGASPRFATDGKRLYCSHDLDLNQEGGESVFRMSVLSEQLDPHLSVDSLGWLAVRGLGATGREKVVTDDDITESRNVSISHGDKLLERIRADQANVRAPVSECELEGFRMIDDEYREWSARRSGYPAVIATGAPKGSYRPGIFARDEAGVKKYALYIDGERRGVGILDGGDNRTKLVYLQDPVELEGGERVEFRAGRSDGAYRVEEVIFLAGAPEVLPQERVVSHLQATQVRAPLVPDPTSIRLTWLTSWPVACRVEWGEGGTRDQVLREEGPLQNHRAYLKGLTPGQRYSAQVVAEGQTDGGEPVEFVAGALPKRTADRPELMRVPLSVLNATGEACADWPVVCGIVLPQGALMEGEPVRLVDAAGEQRDVQAEPAGLWPDGSVKWLHLTFFATVPANDAPRLWLEVGSELSDRPVDQPLLASEEGGRIAVDTGVVTFELPVDGGTALLSDLVDAQSGERLGGRLTGLLTDADGSSYAATVDGSRTVLETNGPLRCVVKLGGKFRSPVDPDAHLFDWEARITAYRGKPLARVLLTVGNDRGEEDYTEIRSLTLNAAVADGAPVTVAADDGADPLALAEGAQLYQTRDDQWTLSTGGEGTRSGGWAAAGTNDQALTVAVRNFWQRYPKALSLGDRALEIGLLPELTEDQYAEESQDRVELVKLYYYMQDGVYKLKQGVTTTHELYLAAGSPADGLPVHVLQDPLTAAADPEWTRSTGAWGDMPVGDSFWATVYDRAMDRGLAAYLADREKTKAYGILNFGDWWGERKYNWGNIEYDTQHAFLQHFVRTGDIRYLYAGEQAARHNGDVDTVHFHTSPGRVGGVYAHCLGHVGGYVPSGFVDGGSPNGGFTVSHTWSEGHWGAFLLTADRRHMENAMLVTDHYSGGYLNNYDFTNCRVPGWHLILALATYRATGDPYYLNSARIIWGRVEERERAGGGWRRHMVPGHCHEEPRHHGNAGFMVGVLMRGLKDWQNEEPSDLNADMLVRAAHYMVDEMWVPEREGFRYTSCPTSSAGRGMNLTSAEGFGYAVTLSGDPELTSVFERGMVLALWNIGGMGKSISHATRGTPHALRDLENLTPTGYRVGPDGEYTFLLNQEQEEGFATQVRRLEGGGEAEAVLYREGGEEAARVRVAEADTDAWIDLPAEGAQGQYRLTLTCDPASVWTVGSTCLQDVLATDGPVTLAGGETVVYADVAEADKGVVRARFAGGGSLTVSARGNEQEVARLQANEGDGWVQADLGVTGAVELRIQGEGAIELDLMGLGQRLSSAANHIFVPTGR